MRKIIVTILICLVYSTLQAQENWWIVKTVKKAGAFLDTMAVSGVDRQYIEAPKNPWQVILRGNINQSDLKLNATTDHAEEIFDFMEGEMTWEPRIKTKPATYAGIWAGYRGYGLGYSWNLGGDKGRILTFGATGGSYGINLRIHWFDNDNPEVYMNSTQWYDDGNTIYHEPFSFNKEIGLGSPIQTRALFLDGYYLFNGKKCSYAAAYDQSVFQLRSAGSLMAGAMYFHSTTHYDTDINADLIMLMNDIGRFKTWQASAGVGYIYNWVPVKGLLISAMAIPMLTFYNHNKIWRYDSNLKRVIKHYDFEKALEMEDSEYRIDKENPNISTKNSSMKINFDARVSVTYEWNKRVFLNAFCQFTNFKYRLDDLNGRLNDWYLNASLGLRL